MKIHPSKWLALPFAFLFGLIVALRNWMYEKGILKGYRFDLPIISVGNLSVGGTGKSPMVLYLTKLLKEDYRTAIMSRGYKRKTSGLVLANINSTVNEIGDEPLLFKLKHPEITVAVHESRAEGIPELLMKKPNLQTILLDDAFQHLSLEPGLNILLSNYHNPFYEDYLMPAGRLREFPSGYQRADIIIVTKCPIDLSESEKQSIQKKINPKPNQNVYFSYLDYGYPYKFGEPTETISLDINSTALVFCGIASTLPLEKHLLTKVEAVVRQYYPDHHRYSNDDLTNMLSSFKNIESDNKIIITTEKDAMRLLEHKHWLKINNVPLYVLPVEIAFFEADKNAFENEVIDFVQQYFQTTEDEPIL